MKKLNENELDRLFREGLTPAEDQVTFRDDDWNDMERMLDKRPGTTGIVRRLIIYGASLAAVLLLAFLLFFNDTTNNTNTDKKLVSKPRTNNTGNSGLPSQHAKVSAPPLMARVKENADDHKGPVSKSFFSLSAAQNGRYITETKTTEETTTEHNTTKDTGIISPAIIDAVTQPEQALAATTQNTDTAATTIVDNKPVIKQKVKKPLPLNTPRFALAIVAAPDVNGVGSLNRGQVGTNYGLLLSYKITNKLSITTGAAYAVKPYSSGFDQYKSGAYFKYKPTEVDANCKVLDIPLNINYQVFKKGNNSFSVGSGLSSYLMLHERYRYIYKGSYGYGGYNNGPSEYSVSNKNKHLLGVLNLNISYQRQINNQFNAIVQPYYKLPLTPIGYGGVDLRSAGVAVGVSWNMNLSSKPK